MDTVASPVVFRIFVILIFLAVSSPPSYHPDPNLSHRSHKDEIGEEIFDMLLSFSDFLTFKQMFLDYKAVSAQSWHCGGSSQGVCYTYTGLNSCLPHLLLVVFVP